MSDDAKKNIHILCVEDDQINQIVVKMILEKLGYTQVSIAGDSDTAIAILEQPDANISIILMDLGLPQPGVNGIELTKIIRQSNWKSKSIPIVALTGNLDITAKENSFAAGMNDFLEKPVDSEKLSIVLDKFLNQK